MRVDIPTKAHDDSQERLLHSRVFILLAIILVANNYTGVESDPLEFFGPFCSLTQLFKTVIDLGNNSRQFCIFNDSINFKN